MKNKTALSRDFIFTQYSDYLLNNGERPKNVYLFAKKNKFEENEFYHFFSGFEQIEKEMLNHFFLKSVELVTNEPHQEQTSAKETLLNVYFVFFENLTMNRSIVIKILGESKLQNLKILDTLRTSFISFIDSLEFKELEILEKANENIQKLNQKSRQEALWIHFLSVLEFWKTDQSPDFEKTDIFIEKTIDTGFELLDNEPLRKMMDLGKFLWKEKFKMG
ncbi:TetR family transcriptional regulator C-terminal domain-containing protein [Pedobacter flavus]|uniref:TetR family transcriptional regulator C-terminal domain-containing protein n=1 Tax=Pedobacter flavus TaxID=3113906 RepID=A0ABU7H0L9_9SPHI|nr:TetR family transcriptional regulator C-terminal domain-containing protein [Pedobacter sp. VNH31]MEE1884796.1 TetR family transcriptional regulator C-terminal domain-containing protein [Pedobacter sp. VNH31]